MAWFKYSYKCPHCGTYLELRMRVTLTARRCPQCGAPITPKEIDRQEEERQKQEAEQKRRLLMQDVLTLDEMERRKQIALLERERETERREWRASFGRLGCFGCFALMVVTGGVGFFIFLIALVALAPNLGSTHQPSPSASSRQKPSNDSTDVPSNDKTAEQKRKDEEAEKAKEQAETKAKEEARKAKEQADAKAIIEAERLELEMVLYELAVAEFYAYHRVEVARQLLAVAKGDEKLMQKVRQRLLDIIDLYPDTHAANDAKQILDGKFGPVRPFPSKPTLPKGITADETEDVLTKRPSTTMLPPDQTLPSIPILGVNPRPVYVRGYARPDKVFVQPHYRMISRKDKQN
jgi:transcription initiation factor TFIIIB Brf1 subunit/transcription initiation factor TFIIB